MSRPRVLLLGWEFPPLINGGLGIACLGMSKALAKHADVSVIIPKADPDFIVDNVELIGLNTREISELKSTDIRESYAEYEEHAFEEVTEFDVNILPYLGEQELERTAVKNKTTKVIEWQRLFKTITEEGLDLFKFGDLYGEDVIYKVIQFSKYAAAVALHKDFDIIHAHDWMTFLAGVEIKKLTGKPLAVHVHSLNYDRAGVDSRGWIYDVEKYAMEQADLVLPVSHYTGDICHNHYGIDRNKIFPVHNGAIPVETFQEEKGFSENLVLFLGRLTHQKGPEAFLEIASKVFERNNNVRFVMAGTGDKLIPLIESGAYKEVGDRFHFTGFLTRDKVNRLLAMADVYCMPSVSEPFGLSALEAAQFGIPAVISKQSGVAEVLHTALKADFWDVDLMAKHIDDLVTDDKLRDSVIEGGYEDLKQLTWEACAEKVLSIFEKVI